MAKNGAAQAKSKEVKEAAKKVAAKAPPYKHKPALGTDEQGASDHAADASAFGAFAQSQLAGGVDNDSRGVVESNPGNVAGDLKGTTMTQQEKDAAAAQAKIAEKEAKQKAAAEKKAAKEAEATEKKAAKEAEKKKREEERAAAKAAREAAGVKESTESMKALSERVKSGTYVKGRNGQLRSSDPLALVLETVAVEKMVTFLLAVLGLAENPYASLNYGQQSMNLRNRLRGAIRKGAEVNGEKLTVEVIAAKRDAMGVTYVPPTPKAPKAPKAETPTEEPKAETPTEEHAPA